MKMNLLHNPSQNADFFAKTMTKAELADYLGISRRTLLRWLDRLELSGIEGYSKTDKILPPAVLKIISEKLCL